MDQGDFRSLLDLTRQQLIALGLGHLADDELYQFDDGVPLPPDKHLNEMLERTADWLRLLDSGTVYKALDKIGTVVEGAPRGAEFSGVDFDGTGSFELTALPELSELRQRLRHIAGLLREARS